MSDLYDDRRVSDRLGNAFRSARQKASSLFDHPEGAGDVMLQLNRMLPAEGWLTERMARLRTKARLMRKGHIARIKELRKEFGHLPPQAKGKVAKEIVARYKELRIDVRIERLDKAVAENERCIRQLTRRAQAHVQAHEHQELLQVLDAASKLQTHNAKLITLIERTEDRLNQIASMLAKQTPKGAPQ
jgi:hypothetical protein